MEIAEVEQNDNEYMVFLYKDGDGTVGYYLSLGHTTRLADVLFDPELITWSMDHIDETCLYLGGTSDEAYARLEELLDFLEEEVGAVREYGIRASKNERLGERGITTCRVAKKPLGGKLLEFYFAKGAFTPELRLTKSAIKQLRTGFKMDRKLHPKYHQAQ